MLFGIFFNIWANFFFFALILQILFYFIYFLECRACLQRGAASTLIALVRPSATVSCDGLMDSSTSHLVGVEIPPPSPGLPT